VRVVCVCVCVCVCARAFVCVCVCVCVLFNLNAVRFKFWFASEFQYIPKVNKQRLMDKILITSHYEDKKGIAVLLERRN
jgi:hypothetical protein